MGERHKVQVTLPDGCDLRQRLVDRGMIANTTTGGQQTLPESTDSAQQAGEGNVSLSLVTFTRGETQIVFYERSSKAPEPM